MKTVVIVGVVIYMLCFGACSVVKYMVTNNIEVLGKEGIKVFVAGCLLSLITLPWYVAKKVVDEIDWKDLD